MANWTKSCPGCGGKGTVRRHPRHLPDGQPDKFDTIDWPVVICDACSGSGEVGAEPPSPQPSKANQ